MEESPNRRRIIVIVFSILLLILVGAAVFITLEIRKGQAPPEGQAATNCTLSLGSEQVVTNPAYNGTDPVENFKCPAGEVIAQPDYKDWNTTGANSDPLHSLTLTCGTLNIDGSITGLHTLPNTLFESNPRPSNGAVCPTGQVTYGISYKDFSGEGSLGDNVLDGVSIMCQGYSQSGLGTRNARLSNGDIDEPSNTDPTYYDVICPTGTVMTGVEYDIINTANGGGYHHSISKIFCKPLTISCTNTCYKCSDSLSDGDFCSPVVNTGTTCPAGQSSDPTGCAALATGGHCEVQSVTCYKCTASPDDADACDSHVVTGTTTCPTGETTIRGGCAQANGGACSTSFHGLLSFADCTGITGYACDSTDPLGTYEKIEIHTIDNTGADVIVATGNADQVGTGTVGTQITAACGDPKHLFSIPTPASFKTGSTQTLSVYAVNNAGKKVLLPGSTTTLSCPAVVQSYCGDATCDTGELCEATTLAGTSFRICTATGASPQGNSVAACYGTELAAAVTANSCRYCGDGQFTSGKEACDPTAAATSGNDPIHCDARCNIVNVVSQCIELKNSASAPIKAGAGNVVQFILTYQDSSATDPFPNIKLRVGPSGSEVGRDANNITQTLVSAVHRVDIVTFKHSYMFTWEAVSTGGVDVPAGTYDVRVMLDGTSATDITIPTACTSTVTVSAVAAQEPVFSINKSSVPTCDSSTGDEIIAYTITISNIGPVQGTINNVEDTYDTTAASLGITPTGVTPTGTIANGKITWVGDAAARTFSAGQSKTYTYNLRIPKSSLNGFLNVGFLNHAVVSYNTSTTTDNTASFDLRTPMNCSLTVIPITGIFDDGRFLLLGIVLVSAGYLVYRYRIGSKISFEMINELDANAPIWGFEKGLEKKMNNRLRKKTKIDE